MAKAEILTIGTEILLGEIVDTNSRYIARLLRGKATGVDITQTSGLSGSGTNVIIRGYSSITGDNQPLFVIDGVPFNTSTATGDQGFTAGGATASSRFLDLDPQNIAEVSILKGLSATVLYGEAGRNGVILITTRNGSIGQEDIDKGLEVSVTQSVSRSEVANLPDYQNTYGNGFNAGFGWFFSNWGAAFADLNPSSYGSDYKGEKNGQVIIFLDRSGQILIHGMRTVGCFGDHFVDALFGAEQLNNPWPGYAGLSGNIVQCGFCVTLSGKNSPRHRKYLSLSILR